MTKIKQKIAFGIEITWLIAAILLFLAAIFETYKSGFNKSYVFFIFTIISVLFYFYRRTLRKKLSSKTDG